MCGIAAVFGHNWNEGQLRAMVEAQSHRGPDAEGLYRCPTGLAGLGHRRLSIIDLSAAGNQPMIDHDGRFVIVFNGEVYNYLELRAELRREYPFRTNSDTEVILAAFRAWGADCLHRFQGMFSFLIWDTVGEEAFIARDRFGVKPCYYSFLRPDLLLFASEIKSLLSAGVSPAPDVATWASYLSRGMYDDGQYTFLADIQQVPAGCCATWNLREGLAISRWYAVDERVLRAGDDLRPEGEISEELISLLEQSIKLRFRADVPVGICLSGGLDSSLLLALVARIRMDPERIRTFTFYCSHPDYDERPWVRQLLSQFPHPASFCELTSDCIPNLARAVQWSQDEPFGGFPTLGMSLVHQEARSLGVPVLLDGNGIDEGWGGYEYYEHPERVDRTGGPVQGASRIPSLRDALNPEFASAARQQIADSEPSDPLRSLQLRDLNRAKLPRALRFGDRVSMMWSRELREPFLDHRIVELGLRQLPRRKVLHGVTKVLLRQVVREIVAESISLAPKRAVQTPQREWIRGALSGWSEEKIEGGLRGMGKDWLKASSVRALWKEYVNTDSPTSSFHIWQLINIGLMSNE